MKKRVKSSLKVSGLVILYTFFMLGIAFITYRIGEESVPQGEVVNLGSVLMTIVFISLFGSIVFYVHIIIHELGHLIAGLISGYTFMLFRIGSLGIIKEKDKFKTISFSMSGTLGQCLMNPPESSMKKPYRLYLSGGVLANLITSFSLLLIYMTNFNNYVLLFAFIGLTAGLMNGIPLGFNDGAILRKINKSPVARDQFFQQLRWNGQFILYHKTYAEVGEEEKIINAKEPITEQFNIYTKLIDINSLFEQMRFEEAYQELSQLYTYRKDIIAPYLSEILRPYLFCLLILDKADPNLVEEIRSNRLFKEQLNKKQVDSYCIKSVIAYYIDNDRSEAEKQYHSAENHIEKAPAFADKKLNRVLLNHIKVLMDF